MNRTQVIFWTDVGIFSAFLIAAGIGLLFTFSFSSGPQGDSWKAIHLYSGILVFAGTVFHLVLHWKWIRATAKRFVKKAGWPIRINFCLDFLLGWVFLLICLSGLNLWLSHAGNPTFFQMQRPFWETMHRGTGTAMTIYVIIHLALHFRWINRSVRRYFKYRKEETHPNGPNYDPTTISLANNYSKGDVP